ncbi:unnamed protein product [Spirodela intermedia]|uniref:Uncharacterized protein n=1 Tax=Spirodela intermedia TaxID=51605 RepID=A0A7I8KI27_SPIIN|nr:unnamed protein product [Spirodela intermedia]
MATTYESQKEDISVLGEEFSRRMEELTSKFQRSLNLKANLSSTRVKAPKPKTYSGERDAMLIENFIWDLQRYINSNTTSEEEKVFVRSLFLAGHAKT